MHCLTTKENYNPDKKKVEESFLNTGNLCNTEVSLRRLESCSVNENKQDHLLIKDY